MFLSKYGSTSLYDKVLKKSFIVDHEKIQFDKVLAGLYLGFAINLVVICLIMRRFALMMIYFIELN